MKSQLALCMLLVPALALGDTGDQRCVDVQFTPTDKLQLVAWIETADGTYVDTIYITQQTGTFGLGNRPGRFDFNSGPIWPYGRRTTTFPVWSHRNGMAFPMVMFQNDPGEDPGFRSARRFRPAAATTRAAARTISATRSIRARPRPTTARPLLETEPSWDTATCPSNIFTGQGPVLGDADHRLSTAQRSHPQRHRRRLAVRRSLQGEQSVRRGLAADADRRHLGARGVAGADHARRG